MQLDIKFALHVYKLNMRLHLQSYVALFSMYVLLYLVSKHLISKCWKIHYRSTNRVIGFFFFFKGDKGEVLLREEKKLLAREFFLGVQASGLQSWHLVRKK